jgi:metal-sulfur cluster biosynthetic enzyme
MTETADPIAEPATDAAPPTGAAATTEPASATGAAAPLFDAERRATELAILDALRAVVDPEIGMNVVELALIKQILLGTNETEIKMILTTPFCPYAGSMIAQVQEQAESVVEHPVKVTLLAERWDPRDAGLMW